MLRYYAASGKVVTLGGKGRGASYISYASFHNGVQMRPFSFPVSCEAGLKANRGVVDKGLAFSL